MDRTEQLNRWRLMLGRYADKQLPLGSTNLLYRNMDDVLDFLYAREYGEEEGVRRQGGGLGDPNLTISEWINQVRRLFPKETVEIMEKQALDRYEMTELLTDEKVLEKLEPNQELLRMILQLKGMMKPRVLEQAKRLVRAVVEELMEKLSADIRHSLIGQMDKTQDSVVPCARNLDMKKTIRRNLKNYDAKERRLVLEKVYFYSRVQQYNTWHVVIAVDESGSMLDSVIHSAVMAGIFAGLPMLETKLVIFDTQVVDLSDRVEDPVETLMSVQLGGGTNIAAAVRYCEGLVILPERTIFVLVSDLYEGAGYQNMYAAMHSMVESGVKVLALTALDQEANPNYDRNAAERLAQLGVHVAALTPKQLADWVGGVIHE